MATINDVSKLAGVSKATVSRVINSKGQVKESTRNAIFQAMKDLNYKPNSLAQALATNSSNSIGLVVSFFDGYYFGILLKEATRISYEAGKQLIVTDGHNEIEREIEAVHALDARKCDVIIIYSRTMSTQDYLELQQSISVPLVVINRSLPDGLGHAVAFDQYHAAELAINYLVEQHHKDIAIITLSLDTQTGRTRLQAATETLSKHQILFDQRLLMETSGKLHDGYNACKALIKNRASQPFSAIFCFNDELAIGAIKALKEANIEVPEEVSVIGIDNEEIGTFFTPELTTIDIPIHQVTTLAMEKALTLSSGKSLTPSTEILKSKLIIRNSVRAMK
ncbi:LacI family transcriptional regulator [Vibrio sp. S17_S38]|uniref:LacI family DNA-binding transcriptional regulator n=1 Tax=Vibrio sp. S17_S38 TaxID=2720229 RepID=UPI00168028D4|nr:LacI family DNA-binding transcriptional regulator [Vibrio sp. S17_S38]MBD1574097.1 LacI family transcriptional regulator [Vibrio sp. S17_S38]